MIFSMGFCVVAILSACVFYLHQPDNVFVFYAVGLVISLALVVSAVLMVSLASALTRGPVRF